MMKSRLAIGLALCGIVASSALAFAADAPKTSSTSKTLFLTKPECTSTAPTTLEDKPGVDGTCGGVAGLPFNEVILTVDGEVAPINFSTTAKFAPVKLDAAKKLTGQISASTWFGDIPGGVGTVTADVYVTGTTTAAKAIDFGKTTVSAPASMSASVVNLPFTISIPAGAVGSSLKSVTLGVALRGQNFNMSALELNGSSWLVIPARKK